MRFFGPFGQKESFQLFLPSSYSGPISNGGDSFYFIGSIKEKIAFSEVLLLVKKGSSKRSHKLRNFIKYSFGLPRVTPKFQLTGTREFFIFFPHHFEIYGVEKKSNFLTLAGPKKLQKKFQKNPIHNHHQKLFVIMSNYSRSFPII